MSHQVTLIVRGLKYRSCKGSDSHTNCEDTVNLTGEQDNGVKWTSVLEHFLRHSLPALQYELEPERVEAILTAAAAGLKTFDPALCSKCALEK